MSHLGFFDLNKRYEGLDAKKDPLVSIASIIPFESFRSLLKKSLVRAANKTRSSVRARVEHVFGHQENSMGGKIVRVVGITRAKTKIGLQNLAYNMSRYVYLRKSCIASG